MIGQRPGVPAWPITAPIPWPTKVTEVGWKLRGTGASEPAGARDAPGDGTGLLDWELTPPLALLVTAGREVGDGVPAATGRCGWPGPGCCSMDAIPGAAAAAAITIAAPATDIVARPTFRRCARWLIRSNVPGGGVSGSTSAFSQASILSCGSLIRAPQRGLEPGARVMQVGLDRALRPAQHHGHLTDA